MILSASRMILKAHNVAVATVLTRQLVAMEHFQKETLRIFSILKIHPSGKYPGEPRKYLAGREADMEGFPHLINEARRQDC